MSDLCGIFQDFRAFIALFFSHATGVICYVTSDAVPYLDY